MAGEYDAKFTEITGILHEMQESVGQIGRLQGGLDEMRLEMRDLRKELRENINETKFVKNEVRDVSRKVDVLTGQFTSVVSEFIKDHKRIDSIEKRVAQLENPVH
ncbi:MAG: hypothetical protein AB7F88_12310 [Pyrinomonadaceae bacterium]